MRGRIGKLRGGMGGIRAAVAAAVLAVSAATPAFADCALIPTALQILPSSLGGVDRPYASPGDKFRLVSAGACDPAADQFALDPANHSVRLSFESGAPDFFLDPALVLGTADCGDDRCFALELEMPDTTNHGPMAGTGEPLAGPVTIHVTNLLTGTEVATAGPLFEPTRACNQQNRFPNLFRHFTLLPPRNSFENGVTQMLGTVDGDGALLVPLSYGEVLTNALGGTANLRLLTMKADVANGLPSPLAGVPVSDQGLIRVPRDGDFVRSFSFEGRPIPPLLEVTSSTPILEASSYGDQILGSVDFIDSVIRIARRGPDPDGPGEVELFQFTPGGLDPLGAGAGPIPLTGLSLGIGPVAPLSSLKTTGKAAAVARDESLEGGAVNPDGDQDDLVVGIIDLDTGEDFSTGFSVLEVAQSPRKAAMVSRNRLVGFLQSEANDDVDVNSDGDKVDGIPRLFDVANLHFTDGITFSADPRAKIDGKGPIAIGDEWLFFLRNELDENADTAFIESWREDGSATTQGGAQPDLSGDGRFVVFVSTDAGIVDDAPVIWETSGGPGSFDGTQPPAPGPFGFFPGDAGIPGFDLSPLNAFSPTGEGEVIFPTCTDLVNPLTGLFWGAFGYPDLALPSDFTMEMPTPTDIVNCTSTGPVGTFVATLGPGSVTVDDQTSYQFDGPLTNINSPLIPFPGGLSNERIRLDLEITDGTFVDLGGIFQFDFTVDMFFVADGPVSGGPHIYLASNTDPTLGGGQANELISKGFRFGEPGNGRSTLPSVSDDGRYVAYLSESTNLVDDGGSTCAVPSFCDHVFLHDRTLGTTVRVTRRDEGIGAADGFALSPVVSGDGSTVAYYSNSTELVDGVGGAFQVYAYDVASGTNELVSVALGGGPSGGPFGPPLLNVTGLGISDDGNEIAFASTASDLVPGDTNAAPDIFVRDRAAGTTERVSLAPLGAQANAGSSLPDLSGDGSKVVFVSAATNLVEADTGEADQCYVYDREDGSVEVLSVAIDGSLADLGCEQPTISGNGRFVTFHSRANNLEGGGGGVRRTYRTDLLTGIQKHVTRAGAALADGMSLPGNRPVLSDDGRLLTLASLATNLAGTGSDTNGVADVYTIGLLEVRDATGALPPGVDLDSDGLLRDTGFVTAVRGDEGGVLETAETNVAAVKVATAAGIGGGVGDLAVFIDEQDNGYYFIPFLGAVGRIGETTDSKFIETSLSREAGCGIDTLNQIVMADPATTLDPLATLTFLPAGGATQVQAVDGSPGSPGGKCVWKDAAGDLYVADIGTATVTAIGTARDFQVDPLGVAFRLCEDQTEGVDLNGDFDNSAGDCEMRFWDFATSSVIRTFRTAVPCTLPGCDPFFEPYRIRGNVLSFVSREVIEVNEFGTGQRGNGCLPTSPAGLCDLTGDDDGDDLAVQIVNVFADVIKPQVFPISEKNPPQSDPFPQVSENEQGVIFLELPAEIVPGFESLPPEQLVSVIASDSDGDGTFDQDGVTNAAATVVDNCRETENSAQSDGDNDGLGADCDVTLDTGAANDDPVTAPEPAEIPGDMVCDLDQSGIISQEEVDQVWADRGVPIAAPLVFGVDPSDNRDPDADGEISAVDHSICLGTCQAQAGGCPPSEQVAAPASSGCGLLGLEVAPLLGWFALRRRRARHVASDEGRTGR